MPRVVLTDRFVAAAKATDSPQIDYFDSKTTGLALRVSKAGRKAWTFIYSSHNAGKRTRLTFGTYPSLPLAHARTLAIEAKGHVDEGTDPRAAFAARDASELTVAMLAENYLQLHVRPNLRSADNFEQRIRKNVIPAIGDIKLSDLTKRDINAITDPIVKRGKPTEANRVFEIVRAMLRWAWKRGDIESNPLEGMTKPAPDNDARDRVLSDDEIRKLWLALPSALAKTKTVQRIVQICLLTGQRLGEVSGMRVSELDLEKRLWSLPASRTKNKKPHTVPLSAMAMDIIIEAITDAGDNALYVFPSGQTAIAAHATSTTIRRAQARFGLAHWTAHDLRRTAATGLQKLGVRLEVTEAVLNHISGSRDGIVSIYQRHDWKVEKAEALNLWAERLAGIVQGDAAKVGSIRRMK